MNILILSSGETSTNSIIQLINSGELPKYNYRFVEELTSSDISTFKSSCVLVTKDLEDINSYIDMIKLWIKDWKPDLVISTFEFSVLPAQKLNTLLKTEENCEPNHLPFRNKKMMFDLFTDKGIRMPKRYLSVTEIDAKDFPIIIKPQQEASSNGVIKISSKSKLNELYINTNENILEQYCDQQLYHLDGLYNQNQITAFNATKYIGTPLEYAMGQPLGGMETNQTDWLRLFQYTLELTRAVNFPFGAFHIEVFYQPYEKIILLECGIRPGGGYINKLFKKLYNINLFLEHILIKLKVSTLYSPYYHTKHYRAIMFPQNWINEGIITKVHIPKMANKNKEIQYTTPLKGVVINHENSYTNNAGTFLIVSPKLENVINYYDNIIHNYHIDVNCL